METERHPGAGLHAPLEDPESRTPFEQPAPALATGGELPEGTTLPVAEETGGESYATDPGPEPGAPTPDEPEPQAGATLTPEQARFEELAYRITFLESVCSQLVRELSNRGIATRTLEDEVIAQAEADVDANPRRITGTETGRSELVAAYIAPPSGG